MVENVAILSVLCRITIPIYDLFLLCQGPRDVDEICTCMEKNFLNAMRYISKYD